MHAHINSKWKLREQDSLSCLLLGPTVKKLQNKKTNKHRHTWHIMKRETYMNMLTVISQFVNTRKTTKKQSITTVSTSWIIALH